LRHRALLFEALHQCAQWDHLIVPCQVCELLLEPFRFQTLQVAFVVITDPVPVQNQRPVPLAKAPTQCAHPRSHNRLARKRAERLFHELTSRTGSTKPQ
jgi:hypothetical protein